MPPVTRLVDRELGSAGHPDQKRQDPPGYAPAGASGLALASSGYLGHARYQTTGWMLRG